MEAEIVSRYTWLGFTHVIPLGFDHILFILSLFLMNSTIKNILFQCTIFTIAHSLTLGLTAAGWILPETHFVEPLIAFSILVTAIENLLHSTVKSWRIVIIFVFGLIHGMGFAGVLKEIGIPEEHFISSVIFFNIGVEIAQLITLLLAFYLIAKPFSKKSWYKERIVYPSSMVIACIALYWTIQRMFE